MSDDRTVSELARDLPWRAPDAARVGAIRDAIVHEAQATGAPAPRRSRRGWVMGAACSALAAAAALFFVLRPDPAALRPQLDVPELHGSVRASAAADFVHTSRVDGTVQDEVVRVRGGRVSVNVDPLAAGERFRVVTGDGEVEVRGTSFDVEVVADRLQSVVVQHGIVDVRLDGSTVATLRAGERWSREVAQVEEPPAPAVEPVPASEPAPAPIKPAPEPTAPISVTESSFRAGRSALRAGDFGAAAESFALAIAADPTAPLAEDARYWRGVALARAGRAADATAALSDFLDRHPTSLHAGRAALVLGNLLLRSGDTAAARARFDAARNDGDPEVRAAADKAVRALDEE
jgi:TolA-binding protein